MFKITEIRDIHNSVSEMEEMRVYFENEANLVNLICICELTVTICLVFIAFVMFLVTMSLSVTVIVYFKMFIKKRYPFKWDLQQMEIKSVKYYLVKSFKTKIMKKLL